MLVAEERGFTVELGPEDLGHVYNCWVKGPSGLLVGCGGGFAGGTAVGAALADAAAEVPAEVSLALRELCMHWMRNTPASVAPR